MPSAFPMSVNTGRVDVAGLVAVIVVLTLSCEARLIFLWPGLGVDVRQHSSMGCW